MCILKGRECAFINALQPVALEHETVTFEILLAKAYNCSPASKIMNYEFFLKSSKALLPFCLFYSDIDVETTPTTPIFDFVDSLIVPDASDTFRTKDFPWRRESRFGFEL